MNGFELGFSVRSRVPWAMNVLGAVSNGAPVILAVSAMPVEEAAELVDALVEREVPLVWKVGGKKRVLDPKMSMKDKTLLLLHSSTGPVPEAELVGWAEHSNPSTYRRDVLRVAHAGDCGGGRLACASGRSRHPT